jgi:integrase
MHPKGGTHDPDSYVFATRTGRGQSADNRSTRVVGAGVKLASEQLVAHDAAPPPERITPHSLRRTFASVLYALGEDPGVVMEWESSTGRWVPAEGGRLLGC